MNLDTLIRTIAAHTDEPLGIVEMVITQAFAEIRRAVTVGEAVHIEGFGKFRLGVSLTRREPK